MSGARRITFTLLSRGGKRRARTGFASSSSRFSTVRGIAMVCMSREEAWNPLARPSATISGSAVAVEARRPITTAPASWASSIIAGMSMAATSEGEVITTMSPMASEAPTTRRWAPSSPGATDR